MEGFDIEVWLAEARSLYHTDAARAEELARRALDAMGPGDGRRADAEVVLGSVAFVRGQLSVAQEHARTLLQLDGASLLNRSEAHLLLGACARRQGEATLGVAHNRQALAMAEELQDPDQIAIASNNLGLSLADAGDRERALACYVEALARFDGVSKALQDQLRGTLMNNIGLMHRARGDHEAALDRFRSGRQAALDAGNAREGVRIGRNLANTLLDLQRPDEAVQLLEAMATEAQAIGDADLLLALSEMCLGQARLAQGRPVLAVGALTEAVDRMRRMGMDLEHADHTRACVMLARAHLEAGAPEAGLEAVRRAMALDRHEEPSHRLLEAEVACLRALGRWEEALRRTDVLRAQERAAHAQVLADQARELRERLELEEREREAERLRTEQTRLEGLVAARTADLETARDQAQAGDRAKTAFLAVASHELRTPLNAIVGYCEMVADGLGTEEPDALREDLQRVLAAADVLTQHVDRILAMANLEAGAAEVHTADVALTPLLGDVAGRQRRLLEARGNRIVVEADRALSLATDPGLLRTLLDELAQNAAKFTEDGTVVLRAKAERASVAIEVEDDGDGIEPAVLDRIFEPFGQHDDSTTRRHGGLGLGLTLCQRYAELLRGVLEVRSVPRQGTCFTLRVPSSAAPQR